MAGLMYRLMSRWTDVLVDGQDTEISEPPILANTEVRVTLESHQIMPSFNTKEQYHTA